MTKLIAGTTHESDTHKKALRINLDPRWYGTFAEIGAGQEVVRWFFRVGGAAGTIAKSISAYDMKVSDAIYGTASATSRASGSRPCSTTSTNSTSSASARCAATPLRSSPSPTPSSRAASRAATSATAGWACKFQAHPRDEPSQIVIHVRMLDAEASLQQEALGIVGVNLCYGAFFLHHEPEQLIESRCSTS